MIIRTLLENTSTCSELGAEHGLSLLIEMEDQTILFDTGASSLFAQNARVMGLDLSRVDLAVISHGHYDHGGGLPMFLESNDKAPVYIQQSAFGEYFTQKGQEWEYIGISKELPNRDRFIQVLGDFAISDSLEILSEVQPLRLNPPDNQVMFKKGQESFKADDFIHEQNLVLHEGDHTVLITGCAHKGIVNIMEQFHRTSGAWPDVVIGGFHLVNRHWDLEMVRLVDEIGDFLKKTSTAVYAGHCTGEKAWLQLKIKLGDQIQELSTGVVLKLFE